MRDLYIGRQPIFDRDLEVSGYELLFRDGTANRANIVDGEKATAQVILNTFMELGLDSVVGNKRAYINMSAAFLHQSFAEILPADRVVIEILENTPVTDELLEVVRGLVDQGYTIALDDFILDDSLLPLVELAHIVKIDLLSMDRAALDEHVTRLRRYDLKLLAEKVETQEEFEYCKALGFAFFQGYFFARPNVIQGKGIPSNRLAAVQLLAKLYDPNVDFRDLEEIVSQDVSLGYKLLRLVNSAYYGQSRQIESIRQSLVLLGIRYITTMISMITLANVNDKPHELMTIAMVRAKMCELLAKQIGADKADTYFTVGLFSALDAILDSPMEEILYSLPLSDHVKRALVCYEDKPGEVLRSTLAYERADWDTADFPGLDAATIRGAYLEAAGWSAELLDRLEIKK